MEQFNPADYGIEGRQTDIRKADVERGVYIVIVPDKDSQWVVHVWRKGTEILGTKKQAEELCSFLKDKGQEAMVLKIAPDRKPEDHESKQR